MKKIIVRIVAASLALLIAVTAFASCGAKEEKIRDLMIGVDVDPIIADEISLSDAEILTATSLELFKHTLSENKGSSLISPISILTALGMTADGTSGNTLSQLEKLFGMTADKLDTAIAYLSSRLVDTESKNVKFSTANSIWLTNSGYVKFRSSYLERVKAAYDPAMYSVDFSDPETVNEINRWVKTNTDGMIEKIIEPGDVDANTVSALVNAIVFDAKWAEKFDKTTDGSFVSYSGKHQDAVMMSCTVSEYFELNGAVGFSKEYDGGKYKFTAFLPNEKTDVFEFIDGLSAEDLIAALNKAENESVKIEMPKFSFDYDLDLIPPLSSLGISDLFGPADFSEMAEVGVGDLYVDMAIHKTHIDLDENGTKAAAATYISTRKNAAMYDHEITLDRPFVYMIIDSETNLPIFMGVMTSVK